MTRRLTRPIADILRVSFRSRVSASSETAVQRCLRTSDGEHFPAARLIRESFGYQITDPGQFARGTPQVFTFADGRHDREQALFVQDQLRLGAWTVNAGVRWDHYHLVVDESAISPRVGVAWSWPAADLVIRASFDRAFQTPAIENLLIARINGTPCAAV